MKIIKRRQFATVDPATEEVITMVAEADRLASRSFSCLLEYKGCSHNLSDVRTTIFTNNGTSSSTIFENLLREIRKKKKIHKISTDACIQFSPERMSTWQSAQRGRPSSRDQLGGKWTQVGEVDPDPGLVNISFFHLRPAAEHAGQPDGEGQAAVGRARHPRQWETSPFGCRGCRTEHQHFSVGPSHFVSDCLCHALVHY